MKHIIALLYSEASNAEWFYAQPEKGEADRKSDMVYKLLPDICKDKDKRGDLDEKITDAIVEAEYLGFAAGLRLAVKLYGELTTTEI